MTTKPVATLLLVSLTLPYFVNSATFENVTVLLSSQLRKLSSIAPPPFNTKFIESSDTLSDFVNLQPLEIVTITNQNIPRLKENSVSNLPNIEEISITSSGIKEVESGTFKNLPRLNNLNLEGNAIEEIRYGVFSGLRIDSLYLHDNNISRIEDEAFSNMTITVISLTNNKISKWESGWFVGSPVFSVYLANNLLEELPADAFSYLLEFKKVNVPLTMQLVLAGNRLKKIHSKAFNHVNGFSHLSLAQNELKDLPKDVFHSVKNINVLDLRNNQIDNVDDIFDDININQLVLLNNALKCFPRDVFDVSRINFVFLDGNPVTCGCVKIWKDFHVKNNVSVVYNMTLLEDNCVEKE